MKSVEVTNADFNGQSWDGAPFKGDGETDWLERAVRDGSIRVYPADLDYAVWDVKTSTGIVRALPGDVIQNHGKDGPFEVVERAEKSRHPDRLPLR